MDLKYLGIIINENDLNNADIHPDDVRVSFKQVDKANHKLVEIEKRLKDLTISDIRTRFRLTEISIANKYGITSAEYSSAYDNITKIYKRLQKAFSTENTKVDYYTDYVNKYRSSNNIVHEDKNEVSVRVVNVEQGEEVEETKNDALRVLGGMTLTALAVVAIASALSSAKTKSAPISVTTPTPVVIDRSAEVDAPSEEINIPGVEISTPVQSETETTLTVNIF